MWSQGTQAREASRHRHPWVSSGVGEQGQKGSEQISRHIARGLCEPERRKYCRIRLSPSQRGRSFLQGQKVLELKDSSFKTPAGPRHTLYVFVRTATSVPGTLALSPPFKNGLVTWTVAVLASLVRR